MKTAVIVDAVRTPIGKSKGGCFRETKADKLCVHIIQALLKRNNVNPSQVDELILGCANQTLEQGFNIARMVALQSLTDETPAFTINMLCGSSLEAINSSARLIMTGEKDIIIAGGVEHLGHVKMEHGIVPDETHGIYYSKASMQMGLTAEFLAITHQVTREESDELAYNSHMRAANADFSKEIIPMVGIDKSGLPILITKDECVRTDTTLEALTKLPPVFFPQGIVTAGNSSGLGDGASCVLLMSSEKAFELGLKPMAKIISMSSSAVPAATMGIGPVSAINKLFKNNKLSLNDIGLIEINEAFASQIIAVMKELDLIQSYKDRRVNPKGSGISLAHPLGMTGARITTTLLHTMIERKEKYGIASLCIGMGMGIATLFERIDG